MKWILLFYAFVGMIFLYEGAKFLLGLYIVFHYILRVI